MNVYRDGKVHVCQKMCKTCIFRAGNLMQLETGRVDGMVADAVANESAIICHSTLGGDENAVCRGFFDQHKTLPLKLAVAVGNIQKV